jgi:hypothetical protein
MKVKSARARAVVERGHGSVTEDEIRQRAYEIFVARGAIPGDDVQDWLRAERELQAQSNRD